MYASFESKNILFQISYFQILPDVGSKDRQRRSFRLPKMFYMVQLVYFKLSLGMLFVNGENWSYGSNGLYQIELLFLFKLDGEMEYTSFTEYFFCCLWAVGILSTGV